MSDHEFPTNQVGAFPVRDAVLVLVCEEKAQRDADPEDEKQGQAPDSKGHPPRHAAIPCMKASHETENTTGRKEGR